MKIFPKSLQKHKSSLPQKYSTLQYTMYMICIHSRWRERPEQRQYESEWERV